MGESPKSARGGSSGIHSLIPIMKSDEQNGCSVSYYPSENEGKYPAYYAFDGAIPPKRTIRSPDSYTGIYAGSQSGGDMDVYINFSAPKRVYYATAIYVTALPWHIADEMILYGSNDAGDSPNWTEIKMYGTDNAGGGLLARSIDSSATAYKRYKIHFVHNYTYRVGVAQIALFGR